MTLSSLFFLFFSIEGGYWKGLNYVFDKREGVGISSTAGVGGVVAGHAKKLKKKKNKKNKKNKKQSRDEREAETNVLGRCCTCNVPWERYVGKKKCYTCGVPVLMCDSCMTQKIEKIPKRALDVRCPLCKEENITVPASMTGKYLVPGNSTNKKYFKKTCCCNTDTYEFSFYFFWCSG